MRPIFLVLSIVLLLIVLIEGVLSYYYSLNYYSKKEIWDSYKTNSITNEEENFVDPYSDKVKSHKRKLSNRYTHSTGGRWAPNTLARKYTYKSFKEGVGLFTDNYGFIHNGNPNRKIDEDGTNNFIFIGGSTAEGANTTSNNENTISANLERILRIKNENINIINAGMSGYKSFDEYMMIYNLLGRFKFKNVIFFHGANDFLSYVYSKNQKWNYYEEIINYKIQYLSNLGEPLYKFKTLHYAGLILNRVEKIFNLKNYKTKPSDPLNTNLFQKEYDTHKPYFNMDDYEMLYKNYIFNLRLIKSLCTEFKIRCKIFLQPTIGQKNIKHSFEEEYFSKVYFKNFQQSTKAWFNRAKYFGKQIDKNDYFQFHDLTGVFNNDENLVYYDLLHYNDYGNKKIAEEISKILEQL